MSYMVRLASGGVRAALAGTAAAVLRPVEYFARRRWDALLEPGLSVSGVTLPGQSHTLTIPLDNRAVTQCLRSTRDDIPDVFTARDQGALVIFDDVTERVRLPDGRFDGGGVHEVLRVRLGAQFTANVTTLAETFPGAAVLLYRGTVTGGEQWDVGTVISDGSTVYVVPGDEANRVYLAPTTPAALVREASTSPVYSRGGERVTMRVRATSSGGGLWLVGNGVEAYTDPPSTLADVEGSAAVAEITPGVWAWVM